ncbi:MAG: putative Sugar-specific transcriptional regulator TrmB [Promethearchaeota archaeon]|nr:MAG: putative Sugar-specific transcriptional regulator TrmB [Candidatus Lokiarchaeota archaeon]
MPKEGYEDYIKSLEKMGLNEEEAKVYFTLINHGKRGTYVRDLTKHLSINRTTLYSIVNRLIEYGCVTESDESNAPKNAKTFIAINPKLYFEKILSQKRKKLIELEDISDRIGLKLQELYLKSMEFSQGEIDDYLKPYISPLIKKGWKVIAHVVEKSQITYGFEAYDCLLYNPNAKMVNDAGFMIFKYDFNVENDEETLKYMYKMLKMKAEEEIMNKELGITDIKLIEAEISLNNKKYQGFRPQFKFKDKEAFIELTEMVILPIKDKIFSLWAESHDYIEEMAQVVFSVEKK